MKINLLLMCMALLTSIPATAYDFCAVNDDGIAIYYNLNSDGTSVSVTSSKLGWMSTEYSDAIVIPSEVTIAGTTFDVTKIDANAFQNCKLTEITMPNSITEIGVGAFFACTELSEITISNSITEIGDNAFYGCTGLTEIAFPNSIIRIGKQAFSFTSLTEVTIPNSVVSIGMGAFIFVSD